MAWYCHMSHSFIVARERFNFIYVIDYVSRNYLRVIEHSQCRYFIILHYVNP